MHGRATKGNRGLRLLAGLLLCAAATGLAAAGTMDIAWDPVSGAAGYTVYWGTAPGTYTSTKDVPGGSNTATTLTGLTACTRYYVAVKAYDSEGLESTDFSNEISGLPRPVVSTVVPSQGEQGAQLTLTITGESFDTGATVEFSGTGITVLATRRDSCSQLSVDIRIAGDAPAGPRDVDVLNPDRSFGRRAGGFTVSANAGPSVTGSDPAAGATGVPVGVQPRVFFDEALDPASVTAQTVRLLDASGAAVPQAAGSPQLSADGLTVTIVPRDPLAENATWRIHVSGGPTGVRDVAGTPMAADWEQNPGFTTENLPPGVVGGLRRTDVR
ncbi:MAG: hypothetical protein Kow0062_13750 [Acidobacteriota bacterium]